MFYAKTVKYFFVTAVISLFAFPVFVFAQSVNLDTNPSFPQEGDTVLFTAEGFGFDIASQLVTWKKDGDIVANGIGEIYFTDEITSEYSLTVEVSTNSGVVKRDYNVSPFKVDLLWEVRDGYTPPFYKGKTLPVKQSNISFLGMVDGSHSSDVVYNWRKGAKSQSFASGLGKNTYSLVNDLLESQNNVGLVAQDSTGTQASISSTVYPFSPELIFYKKTDENGIEWNNTIKQYQLVTENTLNIVAVPFFTTVSEISDNVLKMDWFVNGINVPNTVKKNEIIIQKSNQAGQGKIMVDIDHVDRIYQGGEVTLNLSF